LFSQKKKRISLFGEYQENYFVYRKFLAELWLFVYIAIYSKKDDYDAYSQGCAFSKAWLKTEIPLG
jgi:hypothetical protein